MTTWFQRANRPLGAAFGASFGFPLSPLLAAELLADRQQRRNRPEGRQVINIPYDLTEGAESYRLVLEVPGFRPEEIEVSVDQDRLRIVASPLKKSDADLNGIDVEQELHSESSSAQRSIRKNETIHSDNSRFRTRREFEIELGGQIDAEHISSTLELGILDITLPKVRVTAKKAIPVTVVSS